MSMPKLLTLAGTSWFFYVCINVKYIGLYFGLMFLIMLKFVYIWAFLDSFSGTAGSEVKGQLTES